MKCPFCDYDESKVVDSRPVEEGTMIRRRRECIRCAKRFTTYERIEKRPVPIDNIQRVVDLMEKELYQVEDKEVESSYIGERVMDALKDIDQVAYVRFASVYREFKDVESFMDELNRLMSER